MDRPLEVGAILYSTGQKKCLESTGYLVKSDVPVTEKITSLTGISQAAIDKFGYESKDALEAFINLAEQADAYVGQNVKRFDKAFFENWCTRHKLTLPNKLWIDTRTDLPKSVESKHLGYMAADHGFLNLFPHSALSDCQTVLKLVSMYDINEIVERAKSPEVVLVAHQKFENNQQAKDLKFGWKGDPFKIWYRITKQMDVDEIKKAAPFDISTVDIPLEQLWY